jgi:hypothetical protein
MTSSRSDAPQLDSTLLRLEQVDTRENRIAFLCTDGIFAAANGHFMSQSPLFVDWHLRGELINSATNRIFVCNYTSEQIRKLKVSGWKINFLLDSGHVNSIGSQQFNVLMERNLT